METNGRSDTTGNSPQGDRVPAYNLHQALERLENDVLLLNEVIDIFLEDYENCLTALREAGDQRDAKAITRAAHTLKGAVSNFVATEATQLAHELELLGRQGQVDAALPLLEPLAREVQRLVRDLRHYRSQSREAA